MDTALELLHTTCAVVVLAAVLKRSSSTRSARSLFKQKAKLSFQLPLLTANTLKDLPTSPRVGNRFWGGVGLGGGITPVHTTFVPDISTIVRKGLQENMNPALNAQANLNTSGSGLTGKSLPGFDGFADVNPFTMKTLDAYRMHLWGKMAAQQHMHQQSLAHHQQHSSPSGLASNMRPHFFTGTNKANLPPPHAPSSNYGSTLSALLSGKHSAAASSSYPTPPASPLMPAKSIVSPKEREMQAQREKEQQQAMLAAVASQTILRKLGSAFWDAFTGASTSTFRPNKRPRNLTEEEAAAITRNFSRGDFYVGSSAPVQDRSPSPRQAHPRRRRSRPLHRRRGPSVAFFAPSSSL
ncbi:hypothetical protein NLJ89_g2818 [Agrocybe chaxingu]|uniref:Uncharacterized protein n=1 Tax=Agrocybe chaxingu TaxID=84603 RepID=A0A9W8MW36_9AGAR|nr:hypothetical protein NLJ89_g2818 [Agrocybe chaxingu]